MNTEAISVRNYTTVDYSFILNSWLKSYQAGSPFTQSISDDIYFKFHHKIIDNILNRKSTKVMIATSPTDPNLIFGYAVFEKHDDYNIFHFIYIKRPFSNFGISQRLIDSAPFTMQGAYASHLTHKGKKLLTKYELIYCPYLI